MGFIRKSFGLLAASIAASIPANGQAHLPVDFSKVYGSDQFVDRVPKVKSRGARISVAENKRRSKKKRNIKRARRLGRYTRPGRG
jgi:hypothetical protein